jgi:pectate lyase
MPLLSPTWRLATITAYFAVTFSLANPRAHLTNSEKWFAGDEARRIAENILSYQSELGGWPKNQSTMSSRYLGERENLKPTYDNKATTDELRFLARLYTATKEPRYRASFIRGLDYILAGQYPSGGWPQYHPPGTDYHRHITFNDNAMVRLLKFVREVATEDTYAFVDKTRRRSASEAFEEGIECILKCQIRVNNHLTAWCAQHDENDFRPRAARSFELASLSGSESVGITRLLMNLDEPTPDVVQAVEAAITWFEAVKINNIRVVKVKDGQAPKGTNKIVLKERNARQLWARFYEIESNSPIFADRDGIAKSALADIGYERRNGYAWYGNWPQKLLERDYPAWKKRIAEDSSQ